MTKLVMLYGPHGQSDFNDLKPLLDGEFKGVSEKIVTVIEFNGSSPDKHGNFLKLTKNDFNEFKTIVNKNILDYYFKKKPFDNPIKFGKYIIEHELNIFYAPLLDYFREKNVQIEIQNPDFNDWNFWKLWIELQGMGKANFIISIRLIERSFIKQLEKLVKKHSSASFIIVRGDYHSGYFNEIQNSLGNKFTSIYKKTYG